MSRETILILSPFFRPNVGGVETHLDDLCRYLTEHNYQVFVITYQPLTTKARGLKVEKGKNLEIHRVSWFGHNWFHKLEAYPFLDFLYLTPGLFFFSFLFLLKRKKEIEVIHAQGISTAFITKVLSRVFKKRAVVSIQAIYSWRSGSLAFRFTKWILSSFDSVLTLSKRSRTQLVRLGIAEDRIQVYINWIDQGLFRPWDKEECKRSLGWADRFIVLFVGRFLKIKGIDLLLEVAKKINPKVSFAFVGDGPLNDKIKEASLQNRNVIYIGKVDKQKLRLCYNAADLVILPSQYEEGFGRVILEALSCGVPVIGSNKGGIPEALDSSVGMLIEPTVQEIKEKIEFLFDNSRELKRLKDNCRKYALDRFSIKNAKVIEESYHS